MEWSIVEMERIYVERITPDFFSFNYRKLQIFNKFLTCGKLSSQTRVATALTATQHSGHEDSGQF
jgi:hypothetical protein